MAVPVLAGLPWLAGVIAAGLTSLIQFVIKLFTKRFAIAVGVVAALVGITTAFFAVISGLYSAIQYSAPAFVAVGMGHIVPSNTTACLTAILTAHTARFAYEWQAKVLQFRLL